MCAAAASSTYGDHDDGGGGEGEGLRCGATLKSRRGTVRGVKNRVRQGIATFLRDKSKKVRGPKEAECYLPRSCSVRAWDEPLYSLASCIPWHKVRAHGPCGCRGYRH